MHMTSRCFSQMPDLSDEDITAPVEQCIDREWSIALEYSYTPHLRGSAWAPWGRPMVYLVDPEIVVRRVEECRRAHPLAYVRVNAFASDRNFDTVALSFIARRPKRAPSIPMMRSGARAHACEARLVD